MLVSYYRATPIEPYKTYIDSYKKIIHDSEAKNLSGERLVHPAEEWWWIWPKYQHRARLTLAEFESEFGMAYTKFIQEHKLWDYAAAVAV